MSTEWRDLYDREYPRLLRALVACGGDLDAAEDAAQEAFVRAHREGPAWSTRVARPGAWLLVVATRELFRDRRVRRRTERWPALDRPAPGSPFDAAIDRADLIAALRQLPPRQRAVVVARFYYGLSYNEIASAFAMTSNTVGATLHQALAKLRQLHLAGKLARGAMP
ncbi:MAG: sigma-70 family RNA polymerase sigma factor [Chloroflexota bacterium]|nr:sigma-70 family RNA polymerase sigma factor [Chloroflexota bacterium]